MKQMRTKEFDKVKPYTYLIVRKSDNKKYHGLRYRNKLPGIEDFGKIYFGSSSTDFCKEFKSNSNKFNFRLCWTFDNEKEAIEYEIKVNKKIYKKTDWANLSAYPAIFIEKGKCKGENNGFYGKKHNQSTKEKISLAHKGKIVSEETRQKITGQNNSFYGKKHKQSTKERISLANKGKTRSEEIREKISKFTRGKGNGMFGKKHSEEARQKMSKARIGKPSPMLGKTLSEETRQKISKARIGKPSPMLGKTLSEETRKKISVGRKGKCKGENNYFYGKKHKQSTKEQISKSLIGRPSPRLGKTLSEETRKKISVGRKGKCKGENNYFYGKKHSEETRKKISLGGKGKGMFGKKHKQSTIEKISLANKGKKHSEETKEKISLANKGKTRSEETRKKISLSLFLTKSLKKENYNKELRF